MIGIEVLGNSGRGHWAHRFSRPKRDGNNTYEWRLVDACVLMVETEKSVQLKPATLEAFEAYIRDSEATMEQTLHGSALFLWCDLVCDRAEQVRRGQIIGQRWSGNGPVKIQNGLIHDWIGAAFAPGTTINQALA